eukprot:11391930-Alexandrium_andersonii.AAC.1
MPELRGGSRLPGSKKLGGAGGAMLRPTPPAFKGEIVWAATSSEVGARKNARFRFGCARPAASR